MRYFSAAADFKKETIDKYEELNKAYKNSRVFETYGNITVGNILASGRVANQLPDITLLDLKEYIAYCKQKNINFNYTLNATHMQNKEFTKKGVLEIKNYLRSLYEVGVRSLTIALPSLIELVKSLGYDFEIKASTLCQITNANKARAYKHMGIARIVVDEAINRDFHTLKKIRHAFGENVELIVNPICHKNCIYRMFHYNQVSTDSIGDTNEVSVNYYEHRCVLQRHTAISHLLRLSWIRPEDIKYYSDIGINYFKLPGRQLLLKNGDSLRVLKCYFDEYFDGDLMDLLTLFVPVNSFKITLPNKKLDGFITPFYQQEHFCENDCPNCNYCENFAKKCIDYKEAEKVIAAADEFYCSYDQYKQMLDSITPGEVHSLKETLQEEGDFDF